MAIFFDFIQAISYEDIITLLNQGWVGLIIALIGILISIRISRIKVAEPVYQYASTNIIVQEKDKDIVEAITIYHRNKLIQRLTRTIIIFWNKGNKTIRKKDISKIKPLTITFTESTTILEAKITKTTNMANGGVIKTINGISNMRELTFEYLEPQDGLTIEILHDSEDGTPIFEGTIIDAEKLTAIHAGTVKSPKDKEKQYILFLLFLMIMFFMFVAISFVHKIFTEINNIMVTSVIIGSLVIIVLIVEKIVNAIGKAIIKKQPFPLDLNPFNSNPP